MTFLDRRNAHVKLRYIALIFGIGVLVGVSVLILRFSNATQSPPQVSCSEKPSFEQTTLWLTACLSATASAEDVEQMLVAWGRIRHASNADWGGVSPAHLLPDGNPQLVIRYYPESVVSKGAYWDPQGKLLVMQRDAQHWRVAFDDATLKVERADGTAESYTWQYNLLSTGDVTDDKLDDLLVELFYSNGTHLWQRYILVLTAHPNHDHAELHAAFLQKANTVRPNDLYRFVEIEGTPVLQSIAWLDSRDQIAITRTFSFEGGSFTLAKQVIDPQLCRSVVTTPDDSLWCTFEGPYDTEPYVTPAGLYRVKDGQVSHIPMTALIHSLKVASDGTLYVAAGRGILRYRRGQWETLASLDGHAFNQTLIPTDVAFADNGDVWVAGIFGLARFDGKTWTEYDINARRVLVAPDNSIWTEGWNGTASSDCCFTHLTGNTWVTYTHSARLPVSKELFKSIRALQN
jgi:hypothetical protein